MHHNKPTKLDPKLKNVLLDGWTKNDLVYQWLPEGAVQIPKNLSLPGGFKLGGYGNQYCDVVTATGYILLLFCVGVSLQLGRLVIL